MRTVVGALLRSSCSAAAPPGRAAAAHRYCTSSPAFLTPCAMMRRSFAMAARARPLRAAAADDDSDGASGGQQSEDNATTTPPKRRLAAFDDLFFDAAPAAPAPRNRNNSGNYSKRPAQTTWRQRPGQRTSAAANEEPTQPAAAKAFPQPGAPVAKAQSTSSAQRQIERRSSSSKSNTNSNGGSPEPKASLAPQWQDRAIPPPMEYDYDYYDDEMGVSGYVGSLEGDELPTTSLDLNLEPSGPQLGDSAELIGNKIRSKDSSVGATVSISEKPKAPAKNTVETNTDTAVGIDAAAEQPETKAPSLDRYADIMDTTPSAPSPLANAAAPNPSVEVVQLMAGSSNGSGQMTQVDILTSKSESIQSSVYAENGGKEFNINSPKQVSHVLFGDAGQSTNKDVLDAMASAGNRMADLILQYRQAQRDLKRAKKQVENKENGIHVDDFHKAPPPSPAAAAAAAEPRRDPIKDSSPEMLEYDDANGSNPLLLVDASAYIFRAYYSMPPLHRADGTPVGAVLGFCNMLNRLVLNRSLDGDQPRIVLVFDSKGKTFRHDMYPDYKANRGPCPEDLVPQFDLIREAATAYGIDQIEAPNFEADDVIATLATMAREEGINVHVLTGDKDLMQLVTPPDEEPSINMIDPKEMIRVTYDVVVDKFGVPPALLGDVLALAGDKSDNIPGVPGIGPKIASSLINEYGSLEVVLDRAGEIKQKARREKLLSNTEEAMLSRKLVELDRAVPLNVMTMPDHYTTVSELKMAPLSSDALFNFYEEMGFYDLTMKLKRRLGTSGSDGNNSESSAMAGEAAAKQIGTGNAPLNDNIRQGLIMHQRRKSEAPKPEDYDDVPF